MKSNMASRTKTRQSFGSCTAIRNPRCPTTSTGNLLRWGDDMITPILAMVRPLCLLTRCWNVMLECMKPLLVTSMVLLDNGSDWKSQSIRTSSHVRKKPTS
uniref:Uncharacterized protein n=1 Tax=Cacopsylla melanoneura TaxID=428564 RepID=A0A8D8USJ0_9HEMI